MLKTNWIRNKNVLNVGFPLKLPMNLCHQKYPMSDKLAQNVGDNKMLFHLSENAFLIVAVIWPKSIRFHLWVLESTNKVFALKFICSYIKTKWNKYHKNYEKNNFNKKPEWKCYNGKYISVNQEKNITSIWLWHSKFWKTQIQFLKPEIEGLVSK